MRDFLDGFLTLLAPNRCPGCDSLHDGFDLFCASCTTLVERFSGDDAVFEYGGPVAAAIQRFKYEGRSELGARFGAVMASHAQRWAGEVDSVVPVPLHWRRRRERGYDQAALLASHVGKALGVVPLLRGLRRVRNTPRQVELPHRERQGNVAGAFAPRQLRDVRRVLLVDDVRTTGATLREASAALMAGGISAVHPFVLAARVLGQGT